MEGHIARLPELVEVAQDLMPLWYWMMLMGLVYLETRTRNCRSFCSDQGSGCNLRKFLKIVFRDGGLLLIKGCNRLYAEPFKTDHFSAALSPTATACAHAALKISERTRTS